MMKKKNYEVPMLTVVSFKAERGFALSIMDATGPFNEVLLFELEEEHDTRQVEIYDNPYWDQDGNHFWQ